jgi:hypothetical protein
MRIAGMQVRRRIFVGAGLILVGTGVWYFWSKVTAPGAAELAVPVEAFVKIAGSDSGAEGQAMQERAEFFDPTPLFLPTARSYHQGELPLRVVGQPGQVFTDFPAKLNFAETALPEYGMMGEWGSTRMPEVLTAGNSAPLAGFGQVDRTVAPLDRRSGFLEVKSLRNGSLGLKEPFNVSDWPMVDHIPAEFVVSVSSIGMVGDPVLQISSGSDELDARVREYLLNGARIGERLSPGRYVVMIGP